MEDVNGSCFLVVRGVECISAYGYDQYLPNVIRNVHYQ